jgi:hypothetical protein
MLSRITGKTELTSRQLLIIFNSIAQKFTLAEKTAERNRIFFWFFRVKIEKQCRPTKNTKRKIIAPKLNRNYQRSLTEIIKLELYKNKTSESNQA